MLSQYFLRLMFVSLLIISYYKYGKSYVILCAPKVTQYFRLTRYFPMDDIKGAVELAMIALSHVIFCIMLLLLLPIHFPVFKLKLVYFPIFLIYGVLLGIGCMGLSGLFCKLAVQIVGTFKRKNSYDLKSWLTVGRGGWIKHHLQSMEILPIYLSLLVLTMQVGSEEIIFRGMMLNYFMPFGSHIAFFTSLGLFVGMQAFLMNKWEAAIFPMIGATVMGFIHSVLYLQMPLLWPLIVAHVVFFLFSVI